MKEEENIALRQIWRFRWIGMLFEFSHLEYQRGLWIERKYPNAVGWYAEDVCHYFDDLYLDDDYQHQLQKGIITKEEYVTVKDFHFAFYDYQSADRTDAEIVMDPNWVKVVERGTKAWYKLKTIITDMQELEHMYGLEQNYLALT